MPLPKPRKGEHEDDFISRCMADPVMNKEYPENDQRAAVCHSRWDGKEKNGMSTKETRWMNTGFQHAGPVGDINSERGVIESVSICQPGEATGHGVNLDSDFIASVVEMGNAKKQGLKARFGHPNMCSTALGTFLGRFKNFREIGGKAKADLFLSNEAKETPHGDLYHYVLGMAENEPDMFGTSIVFTPGREYKRDADGNKVYHPGWSPDEEETGAEHAERRQKWTEAPGPIFIECEDLHGCDAVDDPAANDGLFSRFSQETIAGQITEFLDLHPQVWTSIEGNPSILAALGRYADKVDEFITRYRAYRTHAKEDRQMTTDASSEQPAVEAPSATDTPEESKTEVTATEPTAELAATVETAGPAATDTEPESPAKEPTEPAPEPKAEDAETLSRAEFTRIADEFGAEIAAQTVKDGGDYQTAQGLCLEQLRAENATLRERVAELEAMKTGQPAKVVESKPKASVFNTEKK